MEKSEKRVEDILNCLDSIKLNRLTILTGDNGSGKSMVRKQLVFWVSQHFPERSKSGLVLGVSMQGRTECKSEFGALSTLMHDSPWSPTSLSTYHLIKSLLSNPLTDNIENKSYYVIDEPEIGMSRESQLGIALYLKNNLSKILENSLGLLVITHSEIIVENLKDSGEFLNLNNLEMDVDSWLNREIIPTDFEKLEKDANDLFEELHGYQNNGK